MNELQVFSSDRFGEVRTVKLSNTVMFNATDVARALGYTANPQEAIRRHCREHGCVNHAVIDSLGREQQAKFIEEGTLYRLITHSKLKEAEQFEYWVFDEVLPSIRKHGMYAIDEVLDNPDMLISALTSLKEERAKRKALESETAQQKQMLAEYSPKASYYDVVLQTTNALSVSQIAKDYGKSAKWLNKYLHSKGIQYKQGDIWLLYQKYAEQGYTKSKTSIYTDSKGTQLSKLHTYWTQKGRLFIYDLLKQDGILPLVERNDNAIREHFGGTPSDEEPV